MVPDERPISQVAIRRIPAVASGNPGAKACHTWIMSSKTSREKGTPAARDRAARVKASSSSASAVPTWISNGGSPERSAKIGDASGERGFLSPEVELCHLGEAPALKLRVAVGVAVERRSGEREIDPGGNAEPAGRKR